MNYLIYTCVKEATYVITILIMHTLWHVFLKASHHLLDLLYDVACITSVCLFQRHSC